jgi:hypothetical protein
MKVFLRVGVRSGLALVVHQRSPVTVASTAAAVARDRARPQLCRELCSKVSAATAPSSLAVGLLQQLMSSTRSRVSLAGAVVKAAEAAEATEAAEGAEEEEWAGRRRSVTKLSGFVLPPTKKVESKGHTHRLTTHRLPRPAKILISDFDT